MNTLKRTLSLLLTAVLVMSLAAGCNSDPVSTDPTVTTTAPAQTTGTYTVTVQTKGGMAMAGLDVYVYEDSSLTDLQQFGKTDEKGTVSLSMPQSSDYAVVVSGAPKGYQVEHHYSFTGNTANIILTSAPVSGENLAGAALGLGDVMYDFSVVTAAGETLTLSEMLKEKKMVLINFWYSTCGPCASEFPYMEQAYQQYQDKVGIIALDPLEDNATVKSYQESMGLSFPMAQCQASWSQTFNVSGYPTSIVVDRYGVICLIESGALPSLTPFIGIFEHFTAEQYEQKLYNSLDELITKAKPNYTMDPSESIAAAINKGDIDVSYHPETEGESAEYSWPFIITEKNGETCLKASNQQIEDSFAILYAEVNLKAGQAVGFDYLASTEAVSDLMYVIVNDVPITQISGISEGEKWETCYPWVATEDGKYEVALCYLKDSSTNEGDDTVYIKNMRVIDSKDIEKATFIPRYAASTANGMDYTYADVVFNEADGYYHVGTQDGPLLLANLMNTTQFNEEKTVFDMAYNGELTLDGHNYYDELVIYCNYASNAALNGYCTVNKELGELLKTVAKIAGFEGGENEWLKLCQYYQAYGQGSSQLADPIRGLAPFCALKATLGKGVETNQFYYDRPIMPRGLLAEFVPTVSGVYRITSHSDSQGGVDAWLFDDSHQIVYTYEQSERMFTDSENVSMVYYMEAGRPYYIDIAFWDMYEVGYINYDIEYVGATYDLFRLAAPGPFTYDTNATGEAMYYLITGGIDVVLGTDGKYHEDLGKDENGNQKYGSVLYADFTGISALFSNPIATVPSYNEDGTPELDKNGNPVMITGMIDLGGFNFTQTEQDHYILSLLKKNNNDVEATKAYLKELWGEDYDANAESYQIKDVFEGIYHGEGEDLTEEISTYLDQIITTGSAEQQGCVVVTERLAQILQLLMDKYTFKNVDHAWTKLCYYYDHLGPEA